MAASAENIARDLREQIRTGQLEEGDRLPSVDALMQQYGVAKVTATRAIDALKSQGLVAWIGGRGGNVVRTRPRRRLMTRHREMHRDSAGYYSGPEVQHWARVAGTDTTVSRQDAADDIAELLGIGAGTECLVRDRVTGDPEQAELRHTTRTWFAPDVADALPILAGNTGLGGCQDRIEEWTGKPLTWSEVVSSHSASPEEAETLLLPAGVPVLRVLRVATIGRSSRVAMVDDIRMSGELFSLRYPVGRATSARWPVAPAGSDYYTDREPGAAPQ
jgi:GntR family transcriptional regulator